MNTVQIDTGDLILALRGLARVEGKTSSSAETSTAVELCNSLIFYPQVVYDGNVHKSNLTEIDSLITQVSQRIDDADTQELFINKFRPLLLDQATERVVVRKSAQEAASSLSIIEQLEGSSHMVKGSYLYQVHLHHDSNSTSPTRSCQATMHI
jgi:hypothetical protein